jgi:hypothetical protein
MCGDAWIYSFSTGFFVHIAELNVLVIVFAWNAGYWWSLALHDSSLLLHVLLHPTKGIVLKMYFSLNSFP